MISCNHYDYIEIACMHHLRIELILKNGDSVCGVATDTKRNALKQECIESPRVHRRPVCLSQATLPDSFKLS